MKQFLIYYLIIAIPFCLIAGLISGLIVYEELIHHFTDKKRAIRPAIETGIFTFLLFLIGVFFVSVFLMNTKI